VSEPVNASPELLQRVSDALGDDVSLETVIQVLTTLDVIVGGEPVDTMKRNPDTGEIARRVLENGLPVWWIIPPSGTPYRNMQPSLGAPWEVM
jgi:hypothetical protein